MKSVGIYKLEQKRKYLIYGLAKIKMGGSIPVAPFIWRDIDTPMQEIIKDIQSMLNQKNEILPNPVSWSEQEKNFLDNIGLQSQKELYNGTKYVHINLDEGVLLFNPSTNLGKKGFVNIKGRSININESSKIEKIAESLQQAFELCE